MILQAQPQAEEGNTAYRWFVLSVVLISHLGIVATLFAPAALAQVIIEDLDITRTTFGIIISIESITVMIHVVLGSTLVDRLGLKKALFYGFLVLGAGGSLVLVSSDLATLLGARIVQGVGIAICYPVLGAHIMAWFPMKERPYVNTLFASFAFVGVGGAFVTTVELFGQMQGSWRGALSVYGIAMLCVAIGWACLGRDRAATTHNPKHSQFPSTPSAKKIHRGSLATAIRMPVAWVLTVGVFAVGWVYQMYFAFIPLFLQQERGFSLSEAAAHASLLPFSGVVGVITFGLLSRNPALRRVLLWLSSLIVLVGSIGLFFGEGSVMKGGLLIAGFGCAAYVPVSVTYLMSLSGMTPALVAAFLVMNNIGVYLAGFLSPLTVGWLSGTWLGLTNSLVLLTWMEVLAIVMFLCLPDATRECRSPASNEQ